MDPGTYRAQQSFNHVDIINNQVVTTGDTETITSNEYTIGGNELTAQLTGEVTFNNKNYFDANSGNFNIKITDGIL